MSIFVQKNHIVPAIWPVDLNTGANAGDYVSLKLYTHCTVNIACGTVAGGGTAVVTLKQATAVGGTGEKALAFTKYWMTGTKLKINTKTGTFAVGETVTGTGTGAGVVYKDNGDHLLLYTVNGTAFVDAETVTGGTSGFTAKADGIGVDEDILLPCTCSSTFTIPAVSNRKYVIEVEATSLDMDNEYDCMRVHIAQAGAGNIGSADYILSGARYSGDPMPSAIYD